MDDSVIEWLLDSDPAIRWQVLRDLIDAPDDEWRTERAKVAAEGWGAELLSHQDDDGQWDGGAFLPSGFTAQEWNDVGQPWTATYDSITQLREFGFDPTSERARRTVALIGGNSRWDHDGEPFWDGEVEECINGRTVANGAYFGVDVSPIVDRLLGQTMAEGGWNCERENGSMRASFDSTINVLEGMLEFERMTGPTPAVAAARAAAEDFLLERSLFRRLSTGEPADEDYLRFVHPCRWRYDVLRGLDYFRASSQLSDTDPDPRLADAVEHLRDWTAPGRSWFTMELPGEPSRWITLRAERVLRWWDGA